MKFVPLLVTGFGLAAASLAAAPVKEQKSAAPARWAGWVEPDFPFFSSSLDLRATAPVANPWNITPRGIVLNLGHECWACFDTELLRVSAIWSGKEVTDEALAQLSYQADRKTPAGQDKLPKPDGEIWVSNGVYPGWQTGARISLDDPREPQPGTEEPGRGPLAAEAGRFKAVRLTGRDTVLEYTVAGATVQEWMTASERGVQRNFRVAPCGQPLTLVLARRLGNSSGAKFAVSGSATMTDDKEVWAVRVPAHEAPVEFSVAITSGGAPTIAPAKFPALDQPSTARWPREITTRAALSTAKSAYVVDDIALPLDNPWRRNVRLADVAFFPDGTAAGVTFDGDVWTIRGLRGDLDEVRWKRFASGLHEPMGLVIRAGEIFVFDRNGIWRLRDTDGDGEADVHELFSNVFPQSAETREFANSIKLAPDGSFVIAKGGQQATTVSKLNGSVLRVAPDGQSFTVLGYGFRQPFAGVHPRTGLVTASDQEGNYTPTTPLHIVRDGQFYGFLSELLPKEQYPAPIADPLTWIPHAVNASAISQVWLLGAKMGPLNDALVHLGFNKPEMIRVLLNNRGAKPQAAVVSVTGAFGFPPLNGVVNPADGQLYVAGFQVAGWGTTVNASAGLARVRHTGAPVTLPREIVPMDKGVLLRFDVPLDVKKARDPDSYSLASWGYVRTHKYGSPQLKADGTPGQDWLTASSAYLSQDGRGVFIGVPGMKPVMQLRVGWSLATADGAKFEDNAYTTLYELPKFDAKTEGFGDITVDLTPRAALAQAGGPVSVEEGRRLSQLFGCAACHSPDGKDMHHIGPTWKGLYGSERTYVTPAGKKEKRTATADVTYLRESILDPSAKVAVGFERLEAGMPMYAGVLSESQLESLILYLKTLK